MSFFKDFKADFTQAVNELIPDSEEMTSEYDDDDMVNTFDEPDEIDLLESQKGKNTKKSRFFGAFAEQEEMIAPEDEDAFEIAPEDMFDDMDELEQQPAPAATPGEEAEDMQMSFDFLSNAMGMTDDKNMDFNLDAAEVSVAEPVAVEVPAEQIETEDAEEEALVEEPEPETLSEQMETEDVEEEASVEEPEALSEQMETEDVEEEAPVEEPEPEALSEQMETEDVEEEASVEEPEVLSEQMETEPVQEETVVVEEAAEQVNEPKTEDKTMVSIEEQTIQAEEKMVAVDDTTSTYITKGTKITGDMETEGSLDIIGEVIGSVRCRGKLVLGGHIEGNVSAGELYANAARIDGDVVCEGSAKIGVGSVVVGKVAGTSAVIAGAVNGDIDVQGPVIVDSTAVIMGNIKSKSVQINNGAIIEGFCSQCYSDVDVKSFFS